MLTEILCYKIKLYWNIKMHNSDTCDTHSALCVNGLIKSRRMESKLLVLKVAEET